MKTAIEILEEVRRMSSPTSCAQSNLALIDDIHMKVADFIDDTAEGGSTCMVDMYVNEFLKEVCGRHFFTNMADGKIESIHYDKVTLNILTTYYFDVRLNIGILCPLMDILKLSLSSDCDRLMITIGVPK